MSIAADIRAMMADMRTALDSPTFGWKGVDVPCIPTRWGQTQTLDVGGWSETFTLRLLVDYDEWLTMDSTLVTMDSTLYTMDSDVPVPVIGQTLTYGGKTHRIVGLDRDPARSYWTLVLDQPDK